MVKPFNENLCEVKYIVHLDLGGNIPSMIVQTVALDQPLVVNGIRKALNEIDFRSHYDIEQIKSDWSNIKRELVELKRSKLSHKKSRIQHLPQFQRPYPGLQETVYFVTVQEA